MDDAEELARTAADPRTPLTTLQQLAQDHPELRAAVAANPSTYPALLEWLGRLGVPDVDAALARRARSGAPSESHPAPPRPDPAAADQDAPARQGGDGPDGPAVDAPTAVPARAVEPAPDDASPFDPDATAVLTDPDPLRAGDDAAPPSYAPAGPVERPVGATPTDAQTEVLRPVAPAGPRPTGATAADLRIPGSEQATPPPAGGPGVTTAAADPARRRPLVVLLALVGALLLGALVWVLATRGDDEPLAAPTTPAASATATEQPTATTSAPEQTPGDVDAARAALVALPGTTTCDEPGPDSRVFTEFATAAAPGGAWADPAAGEVVLTALRGIQESCDPAYAVGVEQALLADPAAPTAVVSTLNTAADWVELARPAPPGAQERTSFTSPSANIACALDARSASCTIADRAFADPEGCAAGPVTLVVGPSGAATPDCAAAAVTGNGALQYGQSATAGYFACTSEEQGVTCWSTLTGQGFLVARAGFQTF